MAGYLRGKNNGADSVGSLGTLSWDEVGPLMAKHLRQFDIDIYIYIAEGDKEYPYDP